MMSSLQRELNRFYAKILDKDFSILHVTKGAFSQARAKLKPEAFVDLSKEGCRTFYKHAPYLQWGPHRLLAGDGSVVVLPNHPTTREEFGAYKMGPPNSPTERCMARTSIVYDVLNLLTVDAIIDRYNVSEQQMLQQHLSRVQFLEGDLLLLDRAYPSLGLMFTLQQRGIEFCIRLKAGRWLESRKMLLNGEKDKVVTFTLPHKDRHLQKEYPGSMPSVTCRLVVVELESGEKEVLCTSLLNKKKYPHSDFKELYALRWNAEEAYKLYKQRVQWEAFSGKTARNIKQDFYAKVFMMTVCAILAHPIEQRVRKESQAAKELEQSRQINRTNALAFCKDHWDRLWIRRKIKKALAALDEILVRTREMVRPNRKFARNHKQKKPPSMAYKQL
jgi:PIN domain nuclease of toxin-antitoxin system